MILPSSCRTHLVCHHIHLAVYVMLLSFNTGVTAAPARGGKSRSPSWDNCYGRHCEVGEYCGLNEPFLSCRPCTHIAVWCNNTKYVEEHFFPCLQTCKLLLLEKTFSGLLNKTSELEARLNEPTEDNTILKIAVGCTGLMALIALFAVVLACVTGRKPYRQLQHPQMTAIAPPARKSVVLLFSKHLCSMTRCCCHRQPDIHLNSRGQPYGLAETAIRETIDDDDRSSNMVIPGGGTAHQPQDARDFNTDSSLLHFSV
ncbi:uncharacterized protein LOC112571798 [Pomacea canaliculata]|nr:uncharacterized protein LOC112571798 [Pomacea canaliculata]